MAAVIVTPAKPDPLYPSRSSSDDESKEEFSIGALPGEVLGQIFAQLSQIDR